MSLRHRAKKMLVRSGYYSQPGFLIIGAQKAGTTLLYSYLSQHPDILRPAFKEPHFFDRDENYRKGMVQYFKNFELPFRFHKGSTTFEATVDTMYFPECAERVYRYLPEVKLIAVLRDPVERAFSQWNMGHYQKKPGQALYDPRSFEEAIDKELKGDWDDPDRLGYLNRGRYARQLKRFFRYFDGSRVMILDQGEMKEDLRKTMDELSRFLGLPELEMENVDPNEGFYSNKGAYTQSMPASLRERLKELFLPYDEELRQLLGRDLSWFQEELSSE